MEPSIAIEWQFDDKDYGYVWSSHGKNWPILPIGSEVQIEEEAILWRLLVTSIDARVEKFDNGTKKVLYIYIKCKVLSSQQK